MTSSASFPISGFAAAPFQDVERCFEASFACAEEVGAALHITLDGETVVDLWGGSRDSAGLHPWLQTTPANIWSCTKGAIALLMHILADRGLTEMEAPVALHWPEFARNGKDNVCLHHLLTHTAGLPGPSIPVPDDALYDWEAMVHALEQSELLWEPGAQCGYHAATFGWLNGEVARRITGRTVRELVRDEIAAPLDSDLSIGLEPGQLEAADLELPPPSILRLALDMAKDGGAIRRLAMTNPPRPLEAERTARWRRSEIPSSNGYASARGLARLYTPLALGGAWNGVRLLSGEALVRAARERINANDVVVGRMMRRSLGFELPGGGEARPAPVFGHRGLGGSVGFADPQRRLGFGYVTRKMILGPDRRAENLCNALYGCRFP